ncbi:MULTISPECIES: ATP-binding cassette domain-containing protein [Ensifer]|uniref:ATP-binding cassette domain-containing protein n=1 Tax=Ensifer canadensis TaxID=555315 RepID=A0AAW4FI60_9HYPH|nr:MULTISPECIES: ATP-binding cassette domain-containing protein [Ensifer]KQU72681.1 amino acid transporter [Ensifer sp. Root31]KQW56917.1 amino acid transporter [Ensifer sp. Root127]KQW60432.1 amino acid transporter [Ensifer sp. Root1252]KQY57854.1 amino acid transporter [Ensifer sp. Root142]KRC77727.1 amino acid transporter [Ensifer sp. Root231]
MVATALSVKNIHKSFGSVEVLKGVSFEAKSGDVISLIGSSGSGKSTLLRCINYLETPDEGEISVSGEVIRTLKGKDGKLVAADKRQLEHIRTRLGMVFQSFNLWSHKTILENIIEGPMHVLGMTRKDAVGEAEVLMEKVGITPKRDHYPNQLSGGQQQRAAIARALAMKPDVMLFDEPTSALDPELVNEVLLVIKKLAEEGRTMVMVTHEMSLARDISSEVIFLHKGLVEERGAPSQVMRDPKSARLRQFLQMA